MQGNSQNIRMAKRSYHCYECDADFSAMADLNQAQPNASIKCPTCQNEFIEEAKTFQQEVKPGLTANQQPAPQIQSSQSPEGQNQASDRTRPPVSQPANEPQREPASVEYLPPQVIYHDTVIQRTFTPETGWQETVVDTISYDRVRTRQSNSHQTQSNQQVRDDHLPNIRTTTQPASHNPLLGHHAQQPHVLLGPGFLTDILRLMNIPLHINPDNSLQAGLPQEFIDSLPSKTGALSEEDVCSICFDQCRLQDESCELPACKHVFHRRCIGPWLRHHQTCPVCRLRVRSEQPDSQIPAAEEEQQDRDGSSDNNEDSG